MKLRNELRDPREAFLGVEDFADKGQREIIRV